MITPIDGTTRPFAALALAILNRAKLDARRGDLAALAWLIVAGADIAETVTPGGAGLVLAFCRDQVQRVESEQVKTVWGIE